MTGTGEQGWLTTLADLALILFMVTSAQLARADFERENVAQARLPMVSDAPLAVFRPVAGAEGFEEWLASQSADPREQLTISLVHGESDRERQLALGLELAREAEMAGWKPRLVLQRGPSSDVVAVIAFDRADTKNEIADIDGGTQ